MLLFFLFIKMLKDQKEIYRRAEYEINFLSKIRVDVAITDNLAKHAVDAIRDAAATGEILYLTWKQRFKSALEKKQWRSLRKF